MLRASYCRRDWFEVMGRLDRGDAGAVREIEHLIGNQLGQMWKRPTALAQEDVIQDVLCDLIRAWRARRIREPERFPGFVRTLACRRLADAFGRERRACALDRVQATAADEGDMSIPSLALSEAGIDARRAIAKLDGVARTTLEAVYGFGCTYEEASSALGVPLGTLKRRITCAVRELRDSLAPAASPSADAP